MKKKLLSVLLVTVLLLTCIPLGAVSVSADEYDDGYHYTVSGSYVTITGYGGDDADLVIPSELGGYTVRTIAYAAFYNNKTITSVVIPNTVTVIGEEAFYNCGNLQSVETGNGVTKIGEEAFFSCGSLRTIVIGNKVKEIGGLAFFCKSGGTVSLPKSVETIGYAAFNYPNIVYYSGSKADADRITGLKDAHLNNATWYYYSCSGSHTYDNGCDASCNKCQYVRTPKHKYNAATCTKPKTCKTCGATEGEALGHDYTEATCTKPMTCTVCKKTSGSAGEHVYSDYYCDTDCDVCGKVRTAPHVYRDGCDIDCNLCGHRRKVTHVYDTDCDAYCNNCMAYREVPGHVYSHRCDTDCNECYAIRVVAHKYSGKCDTTCNYCGSTRKVSDHTYQSTAVTKATLTKNGYTIKKCGECGETYGKKTTIYKVGKVTLSKTSYTYDGKAKKLTVTVKNSLGKNISSKYYTVTYASGRKNVGTYKVTIKFKGHYSGTKTLTFKINPAKTGISKLTGAKKALTVKWTKKTTQVSGYQIQYSTSKSFKSYKTKTVSSNKTTAATIKSLSAQKTYYVRVRTYKMVNGKKYYSGWSTVKSVKTK